MSPGQRSAATLTALVTIIVAGAVWGWQAVTEPLPASEEPPSCTDVRVDAGDRVRPGQVTVSVFNASSRAGLAGSTLEGLVKAGFDEGEEGNAPTGTRVTRAEIWVDDAGDVQGPAAVLLRSWLGRGTVVRQGPQLGSGVTVVVGEEFPALKKGKRFAVAVEDTTVCGP